MCHQCGSAGPSASAKDRVASPVEVIEQAGAGKAQPQYTTPYGTCANSRDHRATAEVITAFGIEGLDACVDVAFDEGNPLYDAGQAAIALIKRVAAESATGQVRIEAL